MKKVNSKFCLPVLTALLLGSFAGCDNNDPAKEDVPELITEVTLTFTTDQGNTVVSATAMDPDGEGVQDMVVDYPINLLTSKTYIMKVKLINGLVDPASEQYDITNEVAEEGTEHMFFYAWTNNLFASPTGDGNIDSRTGEVNYIGGSDSNDANGMPLGLTTTWTTIAATGTGTFRILLKHQPGLKSYTSGSDIGETDLDVTFDVVVH